MEHGALLSSVLQTLERYGMVPPQAAVLCGFSGGADSVTLLSVLHELSDGRGDVPPFRLYACHVNHGIRGVEADRDEAFCRAFCEAEDIPLFVKKADVPALAAKQGLSEETAGRNVRYAFFEETAERIAQESGAAAVMIATAHTASDNAETMLFHLARGTGLSGLCGIPPVRGNIIRPLIDSTREDVEDYCAEHHLDYVKDSTNTDTGYARNRIRYDVLQVLKELNSGAVANMARTAETLRRDAAFLEELKTELLKKAALGSDAYDVPVLRTAEDAVLVRALSDTVTGFAGVQAEQRHTETLLRWIREGERFKQMQVPGGAYVTLAGEKLLLHWPKEDTDETPVRFRQEASEEGALLFTSEAGPAVTVRLTHRRREDPDFPSLLLENLIDYDKIDFNFVVRTRMPGDSFRPVGRGISKKLKTLYQENDIPAAERTARVILEQDGQIAWLEGFGASEGFAATNETTDVWYVEVTR